MNGTAVQFARAAGLLVILLGFGLAVLQAAEVDEAAVFVFGEDYRVRAFVAVLLEWGQRGLMVLLVAEVARRAVRMRKTS